jgi:hypothetical protein
MIELECDELGCRETGEVPANPGFHHEIHGTVKQDGLQETRIFADSPLNGIVFPTLLAKLSFLFRVETRDEFPNVVVGEEVPSFAGGAGFEFELDVRQFVSNDVVTDKRRQLRAAPDEVIISTGEGCNGHAAVRCREEGLYLNADRITRYAFD